MPSIREFHWFGSFTDPETEVNYRIHRLDSDRMLLRMVCGIVLFGVGGYFVHDVRNPIPESLGWWVLVFGRGTIAVCAIAYGLFLSRVQSTRVMDALTVVMALSVTFNSLWADAFRPLDYYVHVGADVIVIVGIYLVLPLSQTLRLTMAVSYSAGLSYLYFIYKTPPDSATLTSASVSLVIANLLGMLISFRVARVQRTEYAALKNEQDARIALEQAHSEIRSLSGLIPICASCKSVRNDQGFWEQVESYVRDRSEAEFSHSLCPECAVKYRPFR